MIEPHDAAPTSLHSAFGRGLALVGRLVRMHPWGFAAGVGGSALFVSAIVAAAVVIGNIADDVIVPVLDEGASSSDKIWPALFAVAAVSVWKATGIVLRRSGAGWLQYRTKRDLRLHLVDHLLRLELSWFRRQSIGDLLAVSDSDSSSTTFILAPLPFATGSLLLLIGTMTMISFVDPVMAGLAVAAIVTVTAVEVHGSWKTFVMWAEVQRFTGRVSRAAHESFDGALTVKALGREEHETERFRELSDGLRDHTTTVNRVWNIYRVIVEGMLSGSILVILVVGAIRIRSGAITTGELISITYLFSLLLLPIQVLGYVLWEMSHSVAAWARVKAVFDADDLVDYGETTARIELSKRKWRSS